MKKKDRHENTQGVDRRQLSGMTTSRDQGGSIRMKLSVRNKTTTRHKTHVKSGGEA